MRFPLFTQRLSLITPVAVRLLLVAVFLFSVNLAPVSTRLERWLDATFQTARDGDYEHAVAAYGNVLSYAASRSGQQVQKVIYERLVMLSLEAQRYDEARIYLYALADLDGWTAPRRSQLQLILEHRGDTAQATALLHASLARQDDNPRALRSLAQQQIAYLDWQSARDTLERLLALMPNDSEAAYLLGLLLAPHDRTQATDHLTRAATNEPWAARVQTILEALEAYDTYSLTDAHTALGLALVGLGEWPFAEQALQMALEVNAVNPTALAYLGFVRDQQGRDGLPDLQAALEMAPNDPTIYFLLGHHWRSVQDHEAAYDAFSQAYKLDPGNPALAAEVGKSLQYTSNLVGAEEWLRVAVGLAPDDVRWHRMLAAFYADTGFLLDAGGLTFIEDASHVAPDDPDIRTSLGWAYYQVGQYDKANEEFNIALSLNPAHPRTRYYFGLMLEFRGDPQGAADSYWFVVETLGPDTGFGLLAARALQRLGYAPP